ncbi:MAG TPA: DNRLRE domain-containing protein, partial [Patescibacteria group bacterium]
MVLRWGFVVLFFALWQPTGLAQAAETTLTPTADTTVVYSAPSQSFGSEAVVSALYQGGTDLTNTPEEVKEGLLKFDLSSLPKGRTIQSAKLVLKGSGASVTGYGDIRLRRILETWDESTTWATRPKYSAESEANLEVDHNVFPSEIDLTALVRGWYTGSYANNGVVMRAFGDGDYRTGFYSSDDAHISSKEGGNPAQLIIRYSESGTVSSTSSPRPSTTSTPTSLSAGTSTPTPVTTATVTATAVSTPASTATPLSEFFRKLSPCMPEISRLEISLGGDSATVHAILTRSLPLNVYFYTSSKAGPNKLATDYESSQVIKSAASASHSLVLPGLNPGTTYYFTSVVNGKQDCEQSFALLTLTEKGAGPSLLSGSSHGLSAETKSSNPGPGIASLTILAAPFRVVGHLIFGDAGASPLIWGPFLLAILFWGTLTRGALHRLSLLIKWWRNLPNLRYALTHPVKKGSTWGRVMSSLTMQGISRARIWLLNGKTGAIVAQTSSDEHGFFGFSAPAGSYKVKVTHGAYAFPSAIMPFGYRGDLVRVEGANKVVQLDLPMDPAELTDRSFQRMKGWLERFALLRLPLLLILTVFLGLSFLERTTTLQFLAVLLVAYLWWEEWKNIHDAKILARLVDAQNKAVPFALVHFKNSYGRVYSRSVTDNHGEFRAIVPAGVYSLHIITFHQND